MSKKTITDLHQKFEDSFELIKLQKENYALNETIDKLLKEIDCLKSSPVPKVENKLIKIHTTPEEEILDQQIMRLRQASQTRMLEVNEAKMLDLYIKNKRLLEEKSTINADFSPLTSDNMTNEQLFQLIESQKNVSSEENQDTE